MRKELEKSVEMTASGEKRFGLPNLRKRTAFTDKSQREIVIFDKNRSIESNDKTSGKIC